MNLNLKYTQFTFQLNHIILIILKEVFDVSFYKVKQKAINLAHNIGL